MKKLLLTFALVLLLASCAPAVRGACISGKPLVQAQLYFGLGKKNGVVSAGEWQGFVSREIAPRWPEGFTVVDSRGFWLSDAEKRTIREDSKLVMRVHDGSPRQNDAIAAIVAEYKRAFAQEAVMRVDTKACADF